MTPDQIAAWAAAGQSETVEFKRTTGERREATRTLCAMLNDRGELVRFVSDAPIVAYGNPAAAADGAQPLLISAIGREMVAVALYLQSRGGENVWKACSEVAIREENKVQAARS